MDLKKKESSKAQEEQQRRDPSPRMDRYPLDDACVQNIHVVSDVKISDTTDICEE